MANYQQPDFRIPVTPGVEVRPHQLAAASGNPLGLAWPISVFAEKLSDKDDPHGTVRAGRSGR
jgi:hypothetical protein